MRPQNRVFCPQCGKKKIQFATEKKALLFMQYNAEDIMEEKGFAPVRSYYCSRCRCWHLTSREESRWMPTEERYYVPRTMRMYEKEIKSGIRNSINEVKALLHKVNRYVAKKKDNSLDCTNEYYTDLYEKAISIFESINNQLTKEQRFNILHRIAIVRPHMVNAQRECV